MNAHLPNFLLDILLVLVRNSTEGNVVHRTGPKDTPTGIGLVYQVDHCAGGIAGHTEAVAVAFLPNLLIAQYLRQNASGGFNFIQPQADTVESTQHIIFRDRRV